MGGLLLESYIRHAHSSVGAGLCNKQKECFSYSQYDPFKHYTYTDKCSIQTYNFYRQLEECVTRFQKCTFFSLSYQLNPDEEKNLFFISCLFHLLPNVLQCKAYPAV